MQGLLREQIALLQKILDLLTAEEEQGIVYSTTFTTNGLVVVQMLFDPALFSLIIINDGPATIQWREPDGTPSWSTLNATESIQISYKKGRIRSAGFRAQGANSSIRLVGTF